MAIADLLPTISVSNRQELSDLKEQYVNRCFTSRGGGDSTCTAVDESSRQTTFSRTACTPDPVDIVFDIFRHVKIYNMHDLLEIKTLRGNVCGYQDLKTGMFQDCLQNCLHPFHPA